MARAKSATVDLKTRMKEPLRAKIETAAKKRGVSMNAEIVERLEESFRRGLHDGLLRAETAAGIYGSFGGLKTFTVMRLLADAIKVIELHTGSSWEEDPDTFDSVAAACSAILGIFRPEPRGGFPASATREMYAEAMVATESEHLGVDLAKIIVDSWLAQLNLTDLALGTGSKTKKKDKSGART